MATQGYFVLVCGALTVTEAHENGHEGKNQRTEYPGRVARPLDTG